MPGTEVRLVAVALRVWLLGGFRVEVAGRVVTEESWHRSRAKAVVKLLALAPDHRLHREQLMDVLWPGLGSEAAGANLRKAVYFARAATSKGCVVLHGRVLGLAPGGLWIDVDAFMAALSAGDLQAAVDAYAGELLPEDLFEPWTEEPRERLRSRFAQAMRDRAGELDKFGDRARAAELLERLVDLDPLNEQDVGELMRLYAQRGQRQRALELHARLTARLARDLGVPPGPDLGRLHHEISIGRFPAGSQSPPVGTPGPARLGEERKLVTVVFFDAGGSAAAADPELTLREQDRWAALATDIVQEWGGAADRLIGGMFVGVFGVPTVHEDDASRALRCAWEVLEHWPAPVRVGLATGEVIALPGPNPAAGVAGVVIGAAGFLREQAPPGSILVAERTCRLAAGLRFGDPLRMARPDGAEFWARRLAGVPNDQSARSRSRQGPMVGRDSELRLIQDRFADVIQGRRPARVHIVGAAGIGKSRLVEEAIAAIMNRHPATLMLSGRCLSTGHGASHGALGQILRQVCVCRSPIRSDLGRAVEAAGRAPGDPRLCPRGPESGPGRARACCRCRYPPCRPRCGAARAEGGGGRAAAGLAAFRGGVRRGRAHLVRDRGHALVRPSVAGNDRRDRYPIRRTAPAGHDGARGGQLIA